MLHHEFTWSLCLLWSGVQKVNSNPSPLVVRHAPDTQRPGFSSSRNPIFSFICSLRYLQLPAKKSKQNLVCYLCTAPEACTLGSIALSLVYDRLKYQYKLVKHVQNYCHAAEALLGVQGSWLDQMVGTPTSRCVLSLIFLPCDIRLMQERTDNTFQSGFCASLSVPTHRYKISCILVAVGVKRPKLPDNVWNLQCRLSSLLQEVICFSAKLDLLSGTVQFYCLKSWNMHWSHYKTANYRCASCACYQWIQLCWPRCHHQGFFISSLLSVCFNLNFLVFAVCWVGIWKF